MGKKASLALQLLCELTHLTEPVDTIRIELDGYFIEAVESSLAMMHGFEALVSLLESHGIRKAIATSSSRTLANIMLDRFELQERFEFVLTGDDVTHGKPDPEIYLTAAQRLNVPASASLVLEDSHTGSKAAVSAGALTIAVPNVHTYDSDFSHVDMVVESLADPRLNQVLFAPTS